MATLNLPIDASLPTTEQAFSIRVPNGGGVAILGSADGAAAASFAFADGAKQRAVPDGTPA